MNYHAWANILAAFGFAKTVGLVWSFIDIFINKIK